MINAPLSNDKKMEVKPGACAWGEWPTDGPAFAGWARTHLPQCTDILGRVHEDTHRG